jgi:hypothetical protein
MIPTDDPRERLIGQQPASSGLASQVLHRFKSVPLAAYATALLVIVMGVSLGLIAPMNKSIPEPYTRFAHTQPAPMLHVQLRTACGAWSVQPARSLVLLVEAAASRRPLLLCPTLALDNLEV